MLGTILTRLAFGFPFLLPLFFLRFLSCLLLLFWSAGSGEDELLERGSVGLGRWNTGFESDIVVQETQQRWNACMSTPLKKSGNSPITISAQNVISPDHKTLFILSSIYGYSFAWHLQFLIICSRRLEGGRGGKWKRSKN